MTSSTAPSPSPTDDWVAEGWQLIVLRGALAVVFGIVAAAWPITTAVTLIVLWGVWAAVDGISSLAQVFRAGTPTLARVGHALMGVIGIAAAFFAFVRPGLTAVTLTWILGIWLIARGVLGLVLALGKTPPAPRALLVLGAAVDLFLGVLLAANPGRAAVSIALTLGLVAILWGLVFIALGLVARSQVRKAQEAMSRPATAAGRHVRTEEPLADGGLAGDSSGFVPPQAGSREPAPERESTAPPA